MTDNGETPARANVATLLRYQHEERMARALAPPHPSFVIEQTAPAGKTPGFEFSITHPDPDECARIAEEWAARFPAPQPVAK